MEKKLMLGLEHTTFYLSVGFILTLVLFLGSSYCCCRKKKSSMHNRDLEAALLEYDSD